MQPPYRLATGVPSAVTAEDTIGPWKQESVSPGEEPRSSALDALFLLNPQMMWVYDRDTLRIIEVNDAAVAHYGYSREEFLSLSLRDIRPTQDVPRLLESTAELTDTNSVTGEWRHRTKDGRIFHVEIHARAIPFAGRRAALTVIQDITARKTAEIEREHLISQMRYVAGAARCFLWHADIEEGGAEGLKWRMAAPTQETASRLFPVAMRSGDDFIAAWYRSRLEEDREVTNAAADEHIRAGRSFSREFRFRTKKNRIRWASEEVSIEVVEPGRVWRAVGVCTDITERKHTEDTLRYMMDSAQCLLWYSDIEQNEQGVLVWRLRIPAENTAVQRFLPLDVSPDISYLEAWVCSRHPEDNIAMEERSRYHILRNEGYSQEFRCYDKYGKMHWLKEDVHVERVGSGRWRAAGVCTDITQLKEAEEGRKSALEALAASKERYRNVVERVRDVIFQADAAGRSVFLNEAWEDITGYTIAESLGCPLTDIITCEYQRQYADLWATMKSGGVLPGPWEFACTARTGQTLWLEVSAQPTFDTEGRFSGVLGVMRDITERKRLQAHLVRSEKLVALGELAAGVAHEINNPLSVASAMAQFLEMHSDPDVQGDANTIRRMVDRIARIVHSLRTFSYDGQRASKRPVAVANILEDALNIVGIKLRQAEITVERAVSDALPEVLVNPGEIEQVLVNLLMNAEYALRPIPPENRQVRLSAYRDSTASDEGALLCIAVSDTGVGIPDGVKSRIFDPFFTTKDVGEGTGLGLSICHGIIQGHGGTLTVESTVGKGTTFLLTLPAAEDTE